MSVHFSSTLQTQHSPSMSTWNHVGEAAKNIEGGEQQLERDVMCCPSGIYSGDNQPKTIKTRLNDREPTATGFNHLMRTPIRH